MMLAHTYIPHEFKNLSDEILLKDLEDWLGPYLTGIMSLIYLKKLDLYNIFKSRLSWQLQQKLDIVVPSHFTVPSGSEIPIDYSVNPPVLSVKLQEMFGATDTPAILNGALKLTIHLLSPARRPLHITSDLCGFWVNIYPEIKKEMKGRYPKHPWPDDPLRAPATKKIKAR